MKKILCLTGAGISKASGIPTFTEMEDIRIKLSRTYYRSNPDDFFSVLIKMKDNIESAQPNPAHIALARFKVPIVTMNIDGLHQKAGSTEVIELHGNLDFVECKKCGSRYPFSTVKKSILCPVCGTVLDTNVVLYGDMIRDYDKACTKASQADEVLIIGTSFYTSTAIGISQVAQLNQIPTTIINENAEENVEKYLLSVFG
ncbi:MAG TPA: Sir2 family NAD-dependent protein deacetylase [Petrotogaceae bacterium]|nr:Sir2 family NAD-dependent protein deacetylase [Petrotogaceae bacterium]